MAAYTLMLALAVCTVCATASLAKQSPIQKIVGMLEESKAKTQSDLDTESKTMEKYTSYCDEEASNRQYAIDTASRQLEDIQATIEDSEATIESRGEEIVELGTEIASLNADLTKEVEDRKEAHETFKAGEKTLLSSLTNLGQAIMMLKKAQETIDSGVIEAEEPGAAELQESAETTTTTAAPTDAAPAAEDDASPAVDQVAVETTTAAAAPTADDNGQTFLQRAEAAIKTSQDATVQSFLQVRSQTHPKRVSDATLKKMMKALSAVMNAEAIDAESKAKIQSFVETESSESDDDAEFSLAQQMMRPLGQSTAGAQTKDALGKAGLGGGKKVPDLMDTLDRMQEQGETRLAEVRQKEMESQHAFERTRQGLNNEIATKNDQLAAATKDKAVSTQNLEDANSKKSGTEKAQAADKKIQTTLQTECQAKAVEWEQRVRDAQGEMAAIEKAKQILLNKVKVFMQISSSRRVSKLHDSASESAVRQKLADSLRSLAQKNKVFGLSQLATAAKLDPFVKIRGLVENMIAKLEKEAEEAATKEAFCQEEIGKSKASEEDKSAAADKNKARMDSAATQIAEMTQAVQTLNAEVAEIDRTQAEATELRGQENAEYMQASRDYKNSADAVAEAIDVLKSYYDGASFLQIQADRSKASGKSKIKVSEQDMSGIMGLLEIVESDLTKLLSESESGESEAAAAYKKLTQENEVSRAAKTAEAEGKTSQIKTLKVQLSHSTEDYESVAKELDTVTAYLKKLEPECAGTSLTYAEKKAARDAEIAGLNQAKEILDGDGL